MKRILSLAIAFFLTLGFTANISAAPYFTTLQPGQFREINQPLQINIVFVGYHQGAGPRTINEANFRAGLPHRYRTVDINPSNYIPSLAENDQVWIGNSFDYRYNIVYASQAFEDAYFNYVPTISIPCRVTGLQQYYNTQQSRSLNITNNSCIEANLAESWLAQNAPPMLGVDTTKYTIFFINWYDRPDFRFHTYLPFAFPDPDPDTGFEIANFQAGETIAWGGTTPDDEQNGLGFLSRVWFYDLSAGPDLNTTNYLLDAAEFGGQPFYTMPPVWEYGNTSAYRPFDNLSGDLAKITRYTALDCLFTKSPIYPPALSPPKLPNSIQFDLNLYQVDQTWSLHDYIRPDRIASEHAKLRPYNTQSVIVMDRTFGNRESQIFDCERSQLFKFFNPSYPAISCYGNRADQYDFSATDFFLYDRDHLNQLLTGNADFEVPIFIYGIPNSRANPLIGLTDDNHFDGTRSSFIYGFLTNSRRVSAGMTWTVIHEAGHYMGLAHPHDGFDYEDFYPHGPDENAYYFMWAGDESDTAMGYGGWSRSNFSQFDRDNMNRYMTAIYINQANRILPAILSSPRAKEVKASLSSADSDATAALTSYGNMEYLNAAVSAKSAYDKVLAAAAQINIPVEPEAWPADYRRHVTNPGLIDRPSGQQRPNLPLANTQDSGLPIQ